MTSTARPTATPRRRRRATALARAIARGLAILERPEAPYLAALGGLLLVGVALRLNDLGQQSLWFDEADMVMLARQPLGALIRNLGAAGQNGPGHFSGRILRDGQALSNVTVKVVNIHTPGWPRMDVLDTLGGHDGVDVFVTTTDANGNWSVTGLSASKQFMLKVFPPSLCDAYGKIAAGYTTAESGYINSHGDPFMSTRLAPAVTEQNR